jgi:peptidoglycan-associated lipoprotein
MGMNQEFSMRLKALTALSALLFVAACATPAEESTDSAGSGAATTSTTSSSTTSSAGSTTAAPAAKMVKPAGPAAGSQEDLVVNVGDRVFFGYDQYTIKARARGTLERQAAWLRRNASATITVEGHCDERGTREYNLGLGQRRADAVKKYLVALGVAENRIATISYGKERPVAMGSNDEAWAQNRRGVTHIN